MIKIVQGDLLEAKENIIGHQVNCKGVMGSGVAFQIKNRYPIAFAGYELECMLANPSSKLLGKCQFISCGLKIVANLFGQDGYGCGKQQTNIESLEAALFRLKEYAKQFNLSVALPYKIGSDRGGADWNEVYQMIDQVFSDYEVTLYKLRGWVQYI